MAIAYTSTSTGTSAAISFPAPVSKIAWQPLGAATVTVEGSLGKGWFQIVGSSTAAAGTIRTSTGNFLVSQVRLVVSAYATTVGGISVVGV
jgi:hypothetical protein